MKKSYTSSEVLRVVSYSEDNIKSLMKYFDHYYQMGGGKKELIYNIRHMFHIFNNLKEYSEKDYNRLAEEINKKFEDILKINI